MGWDGAAARRLGRGRVGSAAGGCLVLLLVLLVGICSERRRAADCGSDTARRRLLLLLLLPVSVLVVLVVLAVVVAAQAEIRGTARLMVHSHGCAAYFVAKDIEGLGHILILCHLLLL